MVDLIINVRIEEEVIDHPVSKKAKEYLDENLGERGFFHICGEYHMECHDLYGNFDKIEAELDGILQSEYDRHEDKNIDWCIGTDEFDFKGPDDKYHPLYGAMFEALEISIFKVERVES